MPCISWDLLTAAYIAWRIVRGTHPAPAGARRELLPAQAAYVLIGIWQGNQNCQTTPGLKCYEVRDPLDIAIVAPGEPVKGIGCGARHARQSR